MTPTEWLGDKKLAIILINLEDADFFDDQMSEEQKDQAKAAIVDSVFNSPTSLNEFWKECSYGKFWISSYAPQGDVFGPVDVELPLAPESPEMKRAWVLAALEVAENETSFDPEAYDLAIYANWHAKESLGMPMMNPPGAFLDNFTLRALSHEMGHGLGLQHSAGMECESQGETVTLSENCTKMEYYDPFDAMGKSSTATYNQQKRGSLGWFDPGTTLTVTSHETNLDLFPIELMTAKRKVIRVPRVSGPYGIEQFIYVEFRQPSFFDPIEPGDPEARGTLIRLGRGYNRVDRTYLLDATPGTPIGTDYPFGANDAPFIPLPTVPPGPAVFTDPVTGTVITTEKVVSTGYLDTSYALVSVDPGTVLTCTYGNPTTVISPSTVDVQLAPEGSVPVNFQITVTNGDSQYCPIVPMILTYSGVQEDWGPEAVPDGERAMSGGQVSVVEFTGWMRAGATPGLYPVSLETRNHYTGFKTTTSFFVNVIAAP